LCTGAPFRIDNIRAGRPRPGLMRQHLTAVLAATQVGNAETTGAAVGSRSLTFKPGKPRAGDYTFSVGTAVLRGGSSSGTMSSMALKRTFLLG